jgi:NADPH:quinone reductase-like Zn-dependent oxidoreductase
LLDYRRVLKPNGVYVMVGSTDPGHWFGWLSKPIQAWILSAFTSQRFGMIFAELKQNDLTTLATFMRDGKLTPVIDRTYQLSEAGEALRYLEKGHARGKVVVTVE